VVLMRRVFRSVFRRWTRSVLVICVLSFILALLISIPPSITASREATQKTLDTLVANAEAVNATVGAVATQINCHLPQAYVPLSGSDNNETVVVQPLMNMTQYASNITSIVHVKTLLPVYDTEVNMTGFVFEVCGLPVENASLFDVGLSLLPSNVTVGRNLEFGDVGVVVLHQTVADYFGVGVGERVRLLNSSFLVVGVDGYSAFNRTAAYVGLRDVWLLTNNTGNATSVSVFVDDVANVEEVAGRLCVVFPELSVSFSAGLVYSVISMQSQTVQQLELAQATMLEIESMGVLELGIVVVVACVLVLFVMLYTVRERTREVGTLRALGASGGSVLGQFVLEGVLLCFVAGVFGVVVGGFGASFFGGLLLSSPVQAGVGVVSDVGVSLGEVSAVSLSVTITPKTVLFGLGLAVVLGALGSLYPAWRASRIRPAEAMRYE